GDVIVDVAGDDPTDAWLATAPRSSGTAWLLSGLAAMFLVPGPLALLAGLSRSSARARTAESGQPFQGRIVAVEGSGWTINRVRYSCYRYSWRGTDGVEHDATSLPVHPARVAKSAGDAVTVFVDPSAPERGEIKLDS
ncbi:MAG TPA: DUF3592 domain-containing protein, partial [bacterium]|nr:DUF3592 domain-containing protein [bacterium]